MANPLPAASDVLPRPITNSSEAQDVIGHLSQVMDALLGVVDEETALVRVGRLSDAAKLEPTKSQLARHYVTDTSRLKISVPYLSKAMPAALTALRERHHNFQALLQINLTVLATAHAISEGIMRGLSEEITRKASPQTYGSSGRASAPRPQLGQPLAISRVS